MANEKEPTPASYVVHYVATLHTACQAHQMLAGVVHTCNEKQGQVNKGASEETLAEVEKAIRAIAGAVVLNVEMASTKSTS